MIIIGKKETEYLNELLSLPASGKEQDWDLELADKNRILEFIGVYETAGLGKKEKRALWALITASLNDAIEYEIECQNACRE